MLIITLYEFQGQQRAKVNRVAADGVTVEDVTHLYEVRELELQTEDGSAVIRGVHVGTREQVPTVATGERDPSGAEL